MLTIFFSYITNSLNITFLIILLLLLEPYLKRIISAVCLYRVWIVLLIALFIPLRFEFTKALFYIDTPRISIADKSSYELDELGSNEIVDDSYSDQFNIEPKQLSQDKAWYHQALPQLANSWNTNQKDSEGVSAYLLNQIRSTKLLVITQNGYLLLFLIWFAGVVLLFTVKGIQYFKYLKQLKRFLVPIDQEDLYEEYRQCIKELYWNHGKYYLGRLSQYSKIMIRKCSIISSPMTIGIFKPIILLPNEIYLKKDLHFILKHELIHIRRRDSLIKLIRLIVLSLNWYNPFCYLLAKQLEDWCEISCDEEVLYNSTRLECLDYSKLLLRCVTPKRNTTVLINLYGGKNNMKNRLHLIMDRKKKYSSKLLVVLLLGIISTTVIVSVNNRTDVLASSDKGIASDEKVSVTSEENDNMQNHITDVPSNKDSDVIVSETSEKDLEITKSNLNNETTTESMRETIVEAAIQAEGTPYIWGGDDLNVGVDSSGFVQAIFHKYGYDLPRMSKEQVSICENVSLDNLLPGDLIFYANSDDNEVNHVGIYIGEDKVIHAKNAREGVVIQEINYRKPYSAGRIITD